jgi:hypothetical protein
VGSKLWAGGTSGWRSSGSNFVKPTTIINMTTITFEGERQGWEGRGVGRQKGGRRGQEQCGWGNV